MYLQCNVSIKLSYVLNEGESNGKMFLQKKASVKKVRKRKNVDQKLCCVWSSSSSSCVVNAKKKSRKKKGRLNNNII